jgi:hypothetical protein
MIKDLLFAFIFFGSLAAFLISQNFIFIKMAFAPIAIVILPGLLGEIWLFFKLLIP